MKTDALGDTTVALNGSEIDYFALSARFGQDEELVEDLLDLFVDSTDEMLDLLSEAKLSANSERLRETAHRVKGSLREVHATNTSALAALMEESAKAGAVEEATRNCDLLRKSVAELSARLASRDR